MPKRLVIFVEGKGDVAAVPTLANRIVERIDAHDVLFVDREPFRVSGVGTLVKKDCHNWRRWLSAAGKTRANLGAVLLVLDGDLEVVPAAWRSYSDRFGSNAFCAYQVAAALGEEARHSRAGDAFSLATVFAMKEFETWLLSGVEGLRGLSLAEQRGIVPNDATFPAIEVETKQDAKGELRNIIPAYSETLDQADLAKKIDLDLALGRCRSFCRFENAIRQLAEAVRNNVARISPIRRT